MGISIFNAATVRTLALAAAALALPSLVAVPAGAVPPPPFATLYGFSSDAGCPTGALSKDVAGNLYVSLSCGSGNFGSIVQLNPPADAHPNWTSTPLWTFTDSAGGSTPTGGLADDGAGGFYGTTLYGGFGGGSGNGTIFHLVPPTVGNPNWALTTLHFFKGTDGTQPTGGGVVRKGKLLFGTTTGGGSNGAGTIYFVNLATGKLRTIWNFTGNLDGGFPASGLIDDGAGGFYGTTSGGGFSSQGVVYHLTPSAGTNRGYDLTPLYSFTGDTDGGFPNGNLVLWKGSLYGVCEGGGGAGFHGTVWQLKPGVKWTFNGIRQLAFADGAQPTVGPTRLNNTLYVASPYGGSGPGAAYGTIDAFTLSGASWTFTQPVVFNNGNGAYPNSPLLPDGAGGFYGATTGGIFGYGSVFHLTP